MEVLGYMKYSAQPWKQLLYHIEQAKLVQNYHLSGGMRVLREDLEVLREPGKDEEGYENETSSYIVLHSDTWSYLHRLYGGGPTIGRYIYHNQAAPPFDRKKYCHQPLRPETFLLLQPRSLGFKVDLYPLLLRVNLHYRSKKPTKL